MALNISSSEQPSSQPIQSAHTASNHIEPNIGSSTDPQNMTSWQSKALLPQVTLRATFVGLLIGSIVLFSNFQFGLQTGWVSMMGLPSSLLAFAVFKALKKHLSYDFTDVENVYAQSLAVAVGTGPLAFGLVGVIPALEKFLTASEAGHPNHEGKGKASDWHLQLSFIQLVIVCTGLAFFGVFFAVLLRYQIIVKEKLKFPSGSATATLISVLHKSEIKNDEIDDIFDATDSPSSSSNSAGEYQPIAQPAQSAQADHEKVYSQNIRLLIITFSGSAFYTLVVYFVPYLRNLPVFGSFLASSYLWTFQPSPAYVGQGIIMGLPTVSSMLFGAFLGWGVLAPLANHYKWVTGPIDDWKTGGQGWILWISLATMIADTIVSFAFFTYRSIKESAVISKSFDGDYNYLAVIGSTIRANIGGANIGAERNQTEPEPEEALETPEISLRVSPAMDFPPQHLIPGKFAVLGLLLSMVLCVVCIRTVFGNVIPIYSMVLAVALAVLLSILGVRALGETDLNPVSGIGKISQVVFALVVPKSRPGSVLVNLVAGAITEAGAQQAGDLMQDLKTGHLVGATPRSQFVAQMIGSVWSIFLSAAVYKLYNNVYEIPSNVFRIPTALVWIDCARLVNGQGLPPKVQEFSALFAVIFGVIAVLNATRPARIEKWRKYLPSGIAVGIGIYNTPSFTLARFVGGCIAAWYSAKHRDHDSLVKLIILSSGLVLGEGVFSIFSLIMTSLGVPHL